MEKNNTYVHELYPNIYEWIIWINILSSLKFTSHGSNDQNIGWLFTKLYIYFFCIEVGEDNKGDFRPSPPL